MKYRLESNFNSYSFFTIRTACGTGGFCFIPAHLVHLTTFNLEMKQLVDLREFNLSMLIIN